MLLEASLQAGSVMPGRISSVLARTRHETMGCFCYYTYKYDSRTLASRTVYETCSLMYFNVKSVTGGTLVKVFIGLVYNFTDWLTPVELANSFFL